MEQLKSKIKVAMVEALLKGSCVYVVRKNSGEYDAWSAVCGLKEAYYSSGYDIIGIFHKNNWEPSNDDFDGTIQEEAETDVDQFLFDEFWEELEDKL